MATTLPLLEHAAPKHYVWWFPGAPIKIHISLGVVQRLSESFQNSRVAHEGLLLGKPVNGVTEILDFLPAANRSVAELVTTNDIHQGTLSPIGFYRTDSGATLRLNEADQSLAQKFFNKPHHVFL